MRTVQVPAKGGSVTISNSEPLIFILGPCAIESRTHAIESGKRIAEIMAEAGASWIYKSSFDKANRSSASSPRGVGMREGLEILAEVRETCGVPVLTDIHQPDQAATAAQYVDVLQIPAFLCRQTDLLVAAGETGKPVNIKKGQFLAPGDMGPVAEKVTRTGNEQICLCERGATFGYHNLVVDMRSLEIMKETGFPVIFDATHSVQLPGGARSGGERQFVFPLARAAVAVGVAGVFMEVHENPDLAPCDGPNMLPLSDLATVIRSLRSIDKVSKA